MAAKKMVPVKEFCTYHNVSNEFIFELYRDGVIDIVMVKRTGYIPENNLHALEKIIRLYNDLRLNIEGIHAVLQLLDRIEAKDAEITNLRNQLEFYSR